MEYNQVFDALTDQEFAVIYWDCQGLTYGDIEAKFGNVYSTSWIQKRVTAAHRKFGIDKLLPRDRAVIMHDEICPALAKWIDNHPDKVKRLPPPPDEPETPGTSTGSDEHQLSEVSVIEGEIVRPRRGVWVVSGAVLALFCVLVVVAAVIYWWFHRPAPIIPVPTPVPPQSTPISSPFPTQGLSTSVPSTAIPPTEVPTPLPTPAFYEQGQPAILRDGVTVTLESNFVDPTFGGCISPKPGFVIELLIHNSTGSQFLIRFDPAAFHAQDDSGNTYTLKGAGMYICNAAGPQNYPGRSEEALYVSFAGQIPLSASYITITADSLSGVRLVFHKLL